MSCVYKHTFPNGAVYIGKTDMNPEERWLHGWGYRQLPLMFNAIVEFGWKNIKHEILKDGLSHEEAAELELELIKEYSEQDIVMYNLMGTVHSSAQSTLHSMGDTTPRAQTYLQAIAQGHPRTVRGKHIVPLVEKPDWMHSCPIDVYDLSGNYIATYPNAKITSEELNVNQGNVISCCKGRRATGKAQYQSNGYIFRYAPHKVNDLI